MVRKLILRAGPEADFTVYLAPEDQSGFYYQYIELALGYFIDKLSHIYRFQTNMLSLQ